jgi:(S)-2-hydroxyglutarate dehydrogenase
MSEAKADVLVIGAGIIGLATAMQLSCKWPQLRVGVLEKENDIAQHQSGHNSGVIHSGIYYKPGSLKAKLCVQGAVAMAEFCREHNLPLQVCGKVIVAASDDEIPRLRALFERGQANGVPGLKVLDREQLREIEPHCAGIEAIYVPGTAITDYTAVCRQYAEIIVSQGGNINTGTEVKNVVLAKTETAVETNKGVFKCRYVINCAGLHSDRVSRLSKQKPAIMIVPFRGEYYDLVPERQHLVRALIYPRADPQFPFLGVHFTRRVHGGVDAGPNAVLALKREGYRRSDFSARDLGETLAYPGFWRMARKYWRYGANEFYRSFSKQQFVAALQRLVPEVNSGDLIPDGSGVRAQALRPDGSLVDDFELVQTERMLHVWNVPSPAATASLPIGEMIAQIAIRALEL